MIGIEVAPSPLLDQIKKIEGHEQVIGGEFAKAGALTIQRVVGDLQRGVGVASGDLKSRIGGDVRPAVGIEVEALIRAAPPWGYDYGARLDKDGSLRWRSGKFRGRRTWGWFSYVTPRIARKLARILYQQALDRAVKKLIVDRPGGGE